MSMKTPPAIDIIVLTFNGIGHVERCFRAIERTDYPNYHVILVDNGSTDGCADFVAERFPYCHVIRSETNLGFAGGNNLALRLSLERRATFVVLLNDDAYVCDPEWLSRAVAAATSDASVGMVGFEVVQGRGVYDPLQDVALTSPPAPACVVPRIEGCSLFIRTAALDRIGLLDETYFMYAEEDDLEMRAGLAGYSLVKLNSVVFHVGGATSRRYPIRTAYYQSRNYLRFALKNLSVARSLRRILSLCDILCNPFPLVYSSDDVAHVRMRSTGSLLLNSGIYCVALMWNIVHLPQTLLFRFRRKRATYF